LALLQLVLIFNLTKTPVCAFAIVEKLKPLFAPVNVAENEFLLQMRFECIVNPILVIVH
jgi:hypothetical protein